jgi:glycosyltransferase involved in cell wall biosynthesis
VAGARGPIRLALVCARYLPFTGGIELHVHEVARRLAGLGVEVTILTTDPTGELPAHELVEGVTIERVRAYPAERDYYLAPAVYGALGRGGYDVVHVQGYQTFVAPLALVATARRRLPTVLTFHGGGHSSRLRQAIRPLQLGVLRPLLARADRLVTLAPFERDEYARRLHLPPARFVVIPNGSDLPAEAAAGVRREPGRVASLGRLEHYKGHHLVLEAFAHVSKQRAEARLWIGGEGPAEAELRRRAHELGIDDRVEIRGIPPGDRAQMARELARVDTVVSLSEFETQPIAMLEALSLGCKLVVADAPGLADLAASGLATPVSRDAAPASVAEAIVDSLDRFPAPEAPPLPSWDECAGALLALYEDVLARRS